MQQAAINHAAILTAAQRLENAGYTGDAAAFCESLIVGAQHTHRELHARAAALTADGKGQ